MCRLAKIECRVVSGWSKGYGYKPGKPLKKSTDHAWNIVKFDGLGEHHIESTWGAGHLSGSKFVFDYNDFYWMCPGDRFIYNHFPEGDPLKG